MAVTTMWPGDLKLNEAWRSAVLGGRGIVPHVEYQSDPIGWARDKLGIPEHTIRWSMCAGYDEHAWDGTRDPLVVISESLVAGRHVGVESATGTGKSYWAAVLTLWFLACFPDSRVYSYAPKEDQLRLYMWAEIHDLWPRFQVLFPTARLTDLRIRMDGVSDKWGAAGYAVRIRAGEKSATGAQGAHAEHMLLIIEEMPGVEPSVVTAIRNTCTAPHNLILGLGNPDSEHDELHRLCLLKSVVPVRISGHDHPNVVCADPSLIPGAVSVGSLDRMRDDYGVDSRLYRSRGRGISPPEAADALIKREWCDEAVVRSRLKPELREGPPALGVDVANSENGDLAAIARGSGRTLVEVSAFRCPDALKLGRDVGTEIRASQIEDRHVGVDVVGVGSSTVNGLKEEGLHVKALNGGAKAQTTLEWEDLLDPRDKYTHSAPFANLRSQMYWQMRLDLERGLIALPDDPELIDDLTEPVWWTKNQAIHVEHKEDIVKRLGRSPNKGDAAVYWNWVRQRRPLPPEPEPVPDPRQFDTRFRKLIEARNRKAGSRGF